MDPLLGWLAALLLLALALLWWMFFPEARTVLWGSIRDTGRAAGGRIGHMTQQVCRILSDNSRQAGDGVSHFWRRLARHRLLILMLAAVLVAPAALILGLRRHVMLQGYATSVPVDQDMANLVTSLLRGEQLVPPPPLPPAVFITREVERIRPHLGGANRNWALLNPEFRQRLLAVFKVMRDRYGYDMVMIEGYRSPQRQAQLAAEGTNVTHAGPDRSYHQYGLAADCAFYRNGKLVISDDTPWSRQGYQLYGEVAEAAGLVWGGSWKNLRDLGHVELHIPGLGPQRHD
jgi:peptidoglycan LD-endopeptidase CwlK